MMQCTKQCVVVIVYIEASRRHLHIVALAVYCATLHRQIIVAKRKTMLVSTPSVRSPPLLAATRIDFACNGLAVDLTLSNT